MQLACLAQELLGHADAVAWWFASAFQRTGLRPREYNVHANESNVQDWSNVPDLTLYLSLIFQLPQTFATCELRSGTTK